MNPPDQCSSPEAPRSRRDSAPRGGVCATHMDGGGKERGGRERRERGGERERERVNTCMHTRLRGGARARASSAHCCATVCERFEQWGMVFVYLSVEGREGYVCMRIYVCMQLFQICEWILVQGFQKFLFFFFF